MNEQQTALRFAEVPLDLIGRQFNIPGEDASRARGDGLRVFDARVADGLIRVTVTRRTRGRPFWLACVGHCISFQEGRPGRLPSVDEAQAAIAGARARIPDLPAGLVECRQPLRPFHFPMRAFVQGSEARLE